MIQTVNSINPALQFFDQLPNSASVRLPVVMALFACSAATIWRRVKSGHIPKPFKLSLRVTCWNVGKLREVLEVAQ
ncbi:MAG: AlpA family phage regulatory protein [Methylophilaceae bacterium]|nr:AlpA family phage regulatory protein [Methylophilaceae bacterium]